MGFKGTRGLFIIGLIAVAVFILIVYIGSSASNMPSSSTSKTNGVVTITVQSAVGIDRMVIYNLSNNTHTTKTLIDLPFSFNCTKGDTLRFVVSTIEGYEWDGFDFLQAGTFDHHNPLTYQVTGSITMVPNCIPLESIYATPTPPPTPAPSPSPTPSPTPTVEPQIQKLIVTTP